jgi:ABC-type transport system substrate-binding protein
MTRSRVAVALAAALTLVGACTTDSSAPTRVAKNGAHPGGTLRVGITTPASVEPSNAFEPASSLIGAATCDTLVQTDVVTGELRPAMAEAWVISDSGKRFTIKLRKGLRTHGGRKLTASDVVFSLNRLASAENASYEARLLRPIVGFDLVHGDKPTDDEHKRTHLAGVRVLEGSSLEIKLTKRHADFMRIFTHVATAPVPKAAAERDPDAFSRQPDCVGPYALTGPWSPSDTTVTLRRDPRYRGRGKAHTAHGAGYADRIELLVFKDQEAALARPPSRRSRPAGSTSRASVRTSWPGVERTLPTSRPPTVVASS